MQHVLDIILRLHAAFKLFGQEDQDQAKAGRKHQGYRDEQRLLRE